MRARLCSCAASEPREACSAKQKQSLGTRFPATEGGAAALAEGNSEQSVEGGAANDKLKAMMAPRATPTKTERASRPCARQNVEAATAEMEDDQTTSRLSGVSPRMNQSDMEARVLKQHY